MHYFIWKLELVLDIFWLIEGALLTRKILKFHILGKMMRRMIGGIGSLSMKRIIGFTMKPTWQRSFCLIKTPQHLQWQQQVSHNMIPLMGSVFKGLSGSYHQTNENWENSHLSSYSWLYKLPLRKLFQRLHLKTCWSKTYKSCCFYFCISAKK